MFRFVVVMVKVNSDNWSSRRWGSSNVPYGCRYLSGIGPVCAMNFKKKNETVNDINIEAMRMRSRPDEPKKLDIIKEETRSNLRLKNILGLGPRHKVTRVEACIPTYENFL